MTKAQQEFDKVHLIRDYWDSPRTGIADYHGSPHWFENIFDEQQDDYSKFYWLTPISPNVLRLGLQQAEIFLRWRQAFDHHETDLSTHPAFPGDREAFDRLEALIKEELANNLPKRFKVRGELKRLGGSKSRAISDFQVKWVQES